MSTERFEVGAKEKHYVTVSWSILSKHLKIERDGETVTSKMHLTETPEEVEFEVGTSETHHVTVSAGGFQHTVVSVDGKPVQPLS